mmetsp:Transcript_35064/g.93522  ORF Transcript_35064/g.93522 Transcript_35064/m.93522 type:complete len:225 (-) Transcript_35064:39-713(-)
MATLMARDDFVVGQLRAPWRRRTRPRSGCRCLPCPRAPKLSKDLLEEDLNFRGSPCSRQPREPLSRCQVARISCDSTPNPLLTNAMVNPRCPLSPPNPRVPSHTAQAQTAMLRATRLRSTSWPPAPWRRQTLPGEADRLHRRLQDATPGTARAEPTANPGKCPSHPPNQRTPNRLCQDQRKNHGIDSARQASEPTAARTPAVRCQTLRPHRWGHLHRWFHNPDY